MGSTTCNFRPAFERMTLVVTCLTDDVIYQVSDCRSVTWEDPLRIVDDQANKAVIVDGSVGFSHTGVASIEGRGTVDWLKHALTRRAGALEFSDRVEEVRAAATAAFHALPRTRYHAFQAAGWFRVSDDSELFAGIVTIHNGLDAMTGGWMSRASPEFQADWHAAKKAPSNIDLRFIGLQTHGSEREAITRLVQKAVSQEGATPATICEGLVRCVHWLGSRYKRMGRDLVVLSLPRAAALEAEKSGTASAANGLPNLLTPSVLHWLPDSGFRPFDPDIVFNSRAVRTG